MQKEYQLAVDIEKKILTPSFEVNTLDLKTIKLKITITKGMTLVDLTDITVRMSIRKPDGNVLFQDCQVVNAKGGQVEIILENQAYVLPGSYSAEIMCFKGTDKVAVTGSFSYRSIKGIMDDKAVESKSEFTAITKQLDDVQATVNDLRENGTGIDAQARQEVEKVSVQFADIATCKSLGMEKNNIAASRSNYTKLTQAIKAGKSISVDGRYFLSSDGDGVQEVRYLKMIAHTADAEFVFSSNLWTIPNNSYINNLFIDGITWTSESTDGARIIMATDKIFYINELTVSNNNFNGNIGVFRTTLSLNIYPDPDTTSFGFGTITVRNNIVRENRMGMFLLNDMPHDFVLIDNNKIFNFDDCIFSMGLNNTNPYADKVRERMKKISITNNSAICDDSWWSTKNQLYYVFVLYEGMDAEYKSNRVEGLKSEQPNTVVYDVYISCDVLHYKSNFWKNNMSFRTVGKSGICDLMKSKEGYQGSERYYEDNTFIVTPEWVTGLGKPLNRAYNTIFKGDIEYDKLIFRNNVIDVIWLIDGVQSFAKTLDFINNQVRATYMEGALVQFLMLKENFDYNKVSITIKDNDIKDSTKVSLRPDISIIRETQLLYFNGYGTDIVSNKTIPNVYISKNTFHSSLLTRIIGSMYLPTGALTLKDVYIHDNNFKTRDNEKGVVTLTGIIPDTPSEKNFYITNFVSYNNEITVQDVNTQFYGATHMSTVPNFDYSFNYNRQGNWVRSLISFPMNVNVPNPCNVHLKIKLYTSNGVEELTTSFRLYYDTASSRNAIDFTNENGTLVKALLTKTGDGSYSDKDKVNFKLNGKTGNHYLRLYNINTSPPCLLFSIADSKIVQGRAEISVRSIVEK